MTNKTEAMTTLSACLFDERKTELTFHEDKSGLTVVSCDPYGNPETLFKNFGFIVAAHRSRTGEGRTVLEVHSFTDKGHYKDGWRHCVGLALQPDIDL